MEIPSPTHTTQPATICLRSGECRDTRRRLGEEGCGLISLVSSLQTRPGGPHVCAISRVQEMQREEIRRRKGVHCKHVSCSCPCRYHLPASGTGRSVFGFRYRLHGLHCHSKCLPFPYAKRHC